MSSMHPVCAPLHFFLHIQMDRYKLELRRPGKAASLLQGYGEKLRQLFRQISALQWNA